MTELPSRPIPTRSPYGTNPPLEPSATSESRPPVNTRPPLPPPPELSLRPHRHFLHTTGYLLLGAALVVAGWMMLPHGSSKESADIKRQNSSLEQNSFTRPTSTTTTSSLPALPTSATTHPHESGPDPREPGLRHITTLQLAGSYAQAADFAIAASPELRRDFTITAYHEWGRNQPEQAIASAIRIQDNDTREFAIQSVLSGWARSDPEGMAETSLAFPDSDFKKAALTKALRAWMHKDPNLAGDWIMSHPDAVPIADEMFRKDRR